MSGAKMAQRKILMACTHAFGASMQVGSQHLARQFLHHGWQVGYVSAPMTPLHLLQRTSPDLRRRWNAVMAGQEAAEYEALTAWVPFAAAAPDGRWPLNAPLVTAHWPRWTLPSIYSTVRRAGFESVDLLYIDNIFQHSWLEQIPHRVSVFRVMDRHDRFPGWQDAAKCLASDIARRVDWVLYSSPGLEPYVKSMRRDRVFHLPNGVDCHLFDQPCKPANPDPLAGLDGPVALYVGAIDRRVDLELIRLAAARLPQVAFVLIGPLMEGRSPRGMPPNVHVRGPAPHESVPGLMRRASVGLVPFDVSREAERLSGVLPLKLLEYLAAGLPVVSSAWPEIARLQSPARLADTPDDFVRLVARAIEQPPSPETARAFALRHDWGQRYRQLISTIGLD
jgi:glycosyltransferase involved in cell wall biosynthesis